METSRNKSVMVRDKFNGLIDTISEVIASDLRAGNGVTLNVMIRAYNKWQDECHESNGHIYDITSKQDVITLLKGDLFMDDIVSFYKGQKEKKHTAFFRLNDKDGMPCPFNSIGDIANCIAENVNYIISHLFIFNVASDEFKVIHKMYIENLFNW